MKKEWKVEWKLNNEFWSHFEQSEKSDFLDRLINNWKRRREKREESGKSVEIRNRKLELRIYAKCHAVPIAIGIVSASF